MTRVVLALGSNLGERLDHLRAAVRAAVEDPDLAHVRWSPVYETEPVGGPAQDDFLNAVVVADTDLAPHDLLHRVQSWEAAAARERTVHWGPRTLDVDVVAIGDLRLHDPDLTVPHPLAHVRAFVLAPWHDVEPDAVIPGRGRVIELLADLHHAGVRRREDLVLDPEAA